MNIPKINTEATSLVSKKKRHLTFVHITDRLVKIRARREGGGAWHARKMVKHLAFKHQDM
jgi:hypothetical protein